MPLILPIKAFNNRYRYFFEFTRRRNQVSRVLAILGIELDGHRYMSFGRSGAIEEAMAAAVARWIRGGQETAGWFRKRHGRSWIA